MNVLELHKGIKGIFNSDEAVNHAPDGIDIHFIEFRSDKLKDQPERMHLQKFRELVPGGWNDELIAENNNFKYPVFTPSKEKKNRGAILLLHGLNERKYDKYYTWAHKLAKETGKSVILFPISFHLNRGLAVWTDRRLMAEKADLRASRASKSGKNTTFINLALSERLTESPERFFISGLQTSYDIISVLKQIKNGKHPLFEEGTNVDLFAYSIGGLLAQVLYISNPENLLSESKLFLFCAGSMFGDMNGISKVIMDPVAFRRIHKYYTLELEENIKKSGVFSDFFNNSKIGMAFRSMITPDLFKSVREGAFKDPSRQIFALSLKKDKVIPPSKIRKAIFGKRRKNMEVLDFDYPYSHEIPFPLSQLNFTEKIDEAFEKVFTKASLFLS